MQLIRKKNRKQNVGTRWSPKLVEIGSTIKKKRVKMVIPIFSLSGSNWNRLFCYGWKKHGNSFILYLCHPHSVALFTAHQIPSFLLGFLCYGDFSYWKWMCLPDSHPFSCQDACYIVRKIHKNGPLMIVTHSAINV